MFAEMHISLLLDVVLKATDYGISTRSNNYRGSKTATSIFILIDVHNVEK